MAKYETGIKTRERLIEACGELAAEMGFSRVSTRVIAKKAGENAGSIHYHFGGKENLFREVIKHVAKRNREYPVSDIVEKLETELDTPEGKSRLIRELVRRNIHLVFSREMPRWHCRLIYQVLQHPGVLYDLMEEEIINRDIEETRALFMRILPELKYKEALLQTMVINAPIILHADYMISIMKTLGVSKYTEAYIRRLEDTIVMQTQLFFGLPVDTTISFGEEL